MRYLAHCATLGALGCLGCDPAAAARAPHPERDAGGQAITADAGADVAQQDASTPDASAPDATADLLFGADAQFAQPISTSAGEEVLVLANSDLQPVDGNLERMRFAAVVVGLRTLEVLEERAGTLVAETLAVFDPPALGSRKAPLFAWPLDADCDGHLDLAFGGLEAKYVLRGTADGRFGEREPWDRYLPAEVGSGGLDRRLTVGTLPIILPYSSQKSLRAFVRSPQGCGWLRTELLSLPSGPIGSFALGWPESADNTELLVQTRGSGDLAVTLRVSTNAAELTRPRPLQPAPMAPYLAEFGWVATPQVLPEVEGCPARFLGAGVTTEKGGGNAVPALRRLQLFSRTDEGYVWSDLPDSAGSEAYGLAVREAEGDVLVGTIRKTSTVHEFVLFAIRGCGEVTLLATLPIEFDWRTPPAPLFGRLPQTDAVSTPGFVPRHIAPALLAAKALTTERGSRVLFAHYDGYDGRLVEATQDGSAWSLSFHRTTIHEERDDLSFPFTDADVAEERRRSAAAPRELRRSQQ